MSADVQALARGLGLQFNGGTELIGRRDGVVVRVHTDSERLTAEVPAVGFDERVRLAQVAGLPEVAALPGLELHRGWLHASGFANLELLVSAARAVAVWWRAPLVELLEGHGLAPNVDRSRFVGVVRGVQVEVGELRGPDGRLRGVVRARHGCELPADLQIVRPSARRPATDLADVVLDGRLSIAGDDPALHPMLAADAVRGVLLAVLYDRDGSVDATGVQALVPTLREAPAAVRDVADLARALQDSQKSRP